MTQTPAREPFTFAREQDWTIYYLDAEPHAAAAFETIKQALGELGDPSVTDFSTTLDFACGYGRLGQFFAPWAKKIIFADIREDAVEMCRKRYTIYSGSTLKDHSGTSKCEYDFVQNTEQEIPLPDESVSFIYSWDAMVHFELVEMEPVFAEFARILKPGGRGIIQHSKLKDTDAQPGAWHDNHGSRSWVGAADIEALCRKNGLSVMRQTSTPNLPACDLLTIFEKR